MSSREHALSSTRHLAQCKHFVEHLVLQEKVRRTFNLINAVVMHGQGWLSYKLHRCIVVVSELELASREINRPYVRPGASIPLRAWCISPLFQISPYFQRIFRLYEQLSNFYLFPKTFSIFKVSDDLFCHRPQISHFPHYFASFSTFPPCFAKIIIPPYF